MVWRLVADLLQIVSRKAWLQVDSGPRPVEREEKLAELESGSEVVFYQVTGLKRGEGVNMLDSVAAVDSQQKGSHDGVVGPCICGCGCSLPGSQRKRGSRGERPSRCMHTRTLSPHLFLHLHVSGN